MSVPSTADHGSLLHNMSAPPKSVVRYGGLADLAADFGTPRDPANAQRASGAGLLGLAVRFALPVDLTSATAAQTLQFLGIVPRRAAVGQLEALIDARARELPLPDGCAVIAHRISHRLIWSDALTTLAILSKCSDSLWLRDKSPSLLSALQRHQVSLLVPTLFVHRLPEISP